MREKYTDGRWTKELIRRLEKLRAKRIAFDVIADKLTEEYDVNWITKAKVMFKIKELAELYKKHQENRE
jgi:hypothetical protein